MLSRLSRIMVQSSVFSLVSFLVTSGVLVNCSAKADLISDLLEAHNRERSAASLGPLTLNPKLEAAAQEHARDMADHNMMSHTGSDHSTPKDRIARQQYHFLKAGENVAYGQTTVDDVMRSWMNSPPHKANILGDFTEMGGACVYSKSGTPYWCTVFGKPRPVLAPDNAAAGAVAALDRERQKLKLPPFTVNPTLQAASQRHAHDMAAHGNVRAQDDDGLSPLQRVEKAGYRFGRLSEMMAVGPTSPEEVVATWLKDPAQKDSLLREFGEVGVGYASAADGVSYWCALFALPAR